MIGQKLQWGWASLRLLDQVTIPREYDAENAGTLIYKTRATFYGLLYVKSVPCPTSKRPCGEFALESDVMPSYGDVDSMLTARTLRHMGFFLVVRLL